MLELGTVADGALKLLEPDRPVAVSVELIEDIIEKLAVYSAALFLKGCLKLCFIQRLVVGLDILIRTRVGCVGACSYGILPVQHQLGER